MMNTLFKESNSRLLSGKSYIFVRGLLSVLMLSLSFFCSGEICKDANVTNPEIEHNLKNGLLVDPSWEWNTFMGSASADFGECIAVDGSGNIYVAGRSTESWGSPVNAFAGGDDVFVAKLNSSGELLWNTFMGSPNFDYGESIAIDSEGNVYVAGRSYLTWGSPVNPLTGDYGYDAFAAKLNSSGELQWNTFMGSPGIEYCRSIATDGEGNVYIAGSSEESWGSPVNAFAGTYDAFAVKLNGDGILQWNTFLGSSGDDGGQGITVDDAGKVYFTGSSDAAWGTPLIDHTGDYDAFVAKLNSNGVTEWNTFMGSSSEDYGFGIAVDGGSNVYVTGSSLETWGVPVNEYAGGYDTDAFAAKLNNNGELQWNTFMGNTYSDAGKSISVDGSGNVYIAGESDATWGSPMNAFSEGHYPDVFSVKLNTGGEIQGNTFMGSSDFDYGESTAVDGNGNVYITGRSYISWGSPVNAHAGDDDAFAIKFNYSNKVNFVADLSLPTECTLSQNFPNPFVTSTVIQYNLPRTDQVILKVYNIQGKELRTLVNRIQDQGNYAITFDANQLPGGIYLYEIRIGTGFVKMNKMTVLSP